LHGVIVRQSTILVFVSTDIGARRGDDDAVREVSPALVARVSHNRAKEEARPLGEIGWMFIARKD